MSIIDKYAYQIILLINMYDCDKMKSLNFYSVIDIGWAF